MNVGLFADYEKSIILFGRERVYPFILTINSQQRLSYKFNLLPRLNYNFLTTPIKHQSSSSFITFTKDLQSELFKQNTHLLLTVRSNHSAGMSPPKNEMVSSNEDRKKAENDARESQGEALKDARESREEAREEADDESQLPEGKGKPWKVNECYVFFGIKDCPICKELCG